MMIDNANISNLYAAIIAGLFGLLFGSFLNVCLTRLPQGESILWPGSHCRQCAHKLSWWENIPVLSWVFLRGRCRACHKPIGVRYMLVELANGLTWAGAVVRSDHASEAVGTMLFFSLLIALFVLDAEHMWLPDLVTIPGAIAAFFYHAEAHDKHTAMAAFFSGIAWAAILLLIRWLYWVIRRREGMGLGDVKLMLMLGTWLGFSGGLDAMILAVLMALLFALVILAAKKDDRSWATVALPFGSFLCLAAIVVRLVGSPLFTAWW